MSCKLPELPQSSKDNAKAKKGIKCCSKKLKESPTNRSVAKAKPPKQVPSIKCNSVAKPVQTKTNVEEEHICNRPKLYRSAAETASYLEQHVVPIIMEGMLDLAREQPEDPIHYLEKFWREDKHKCSVPLPTNLL